MPEDNTLESLAETLAGTEEDQPETESESDEDEEEGQEQESTEDEDAESEESEESEDDQPEKESPQDRVIEWKTADGTEYKVPEKELRDGYMRSQDYTQKTQALSKDREQAESEIQNRSQRQFETMNMFGEKIGELHMARAAASHLESQLKGINRNDDPARYAIVQSDLQTARSTVADLTDRLGKASQLMQAQKDDQMKKAQQETVKVLSAEIPDFQDRLKVWNKHAVETYGYTPSELSQVTDPRALRILDDAAKYRDLQNRKPEVVKKAAAAPAKQTRSTPPSSIDKAKKSHAQKRDVNSLAAILMASQKG